LRLYVNEGLKFAACNLIIHKAHAVPDNFVTVRAILLHKGRLGLNF
jgi:hypothetical protein